MTFMRDRIPTTVLLLVMGKRVSVVTNPWISSDILGYAYRVVLSSVTTVLVEAY